MIPAPDRRFRMRAAVSTETAAPSNKLWNADLAPVPVEERSWGLYQYASLWVALSVCIPTYMLAGGLIAGGMSWKQAIGTILLGNLIVLIPIVLNAQAGARYGISFSVYVRASFGVLGANVPAVLRALVACGWFGIQCWIGGEAIWSVIQMLWPGSALHPTGLWICFFLFWALNVTMVGRGIGAVRRLQVFSAPFLLGVGLLLLFWVVPEAGGLGPVLATPSKFQTTREFVRFFIPSLTGVVGFWAAVALNISDFTRYAKSQKAQRVGQALALPLAMTAYSSIGVAVTLASVVIFGKAIWDPAELLGRLGRAGQLQAPLIASIALVALAIVTLSTNVAVHGVSSAKDFSNLLPRHLSFRAGGLIVGLLSIAMMPWKVLTDSSIYIFGWLVGSSGLLGPIAGIMIADYFIVRRQSLDVEGLYRRLGAYEYTDGFNLRAQLALGAGVVVAMAGLFLPALRWLYDFAWFVGFGVSAMAYIALMTGPDDPASIPPNPLLLRVEGFKAEQTFPTA